MGMSESGNESPEKREARAHSELLRALEDERLLGEKIDLLIRSATNQEDAEREILAGLAGRFDEAQRRSREALSAWLSY